jgi:hypothetical protein
MSVGVGSPFGGLGVGLSALRMSEHLSEVHRTNLKGFMKALLET